MFKLAMRKRFVDVFVRRKQYQRRFISSSSSAIPLLYESDDVEVYGRPVGPMHMNMSLCVCKQTKQAVIVDAGDPEPESSFLELAKRKKISIEAIWQTHAHIDHVLGLAKTKAMVPDAQIHLHPSDRFVAFSSLAPFLCPTCCF